MARCTARARWYLDSCFGELQKLYGEVFETAPFMHGADTAGAEYDAAFIVAICTRVTDRADSATIYEVIAGWRKAVVSVNHTRAYLSEYPDTEWALREQPAGYKAFDSTRELVDDLVDTVTSASSDGTVVFNTTLARYLILTGNDTANVGDLSARVLVTYAYLASPDNMTVASDTDDPIVQAFNAAKRMSFVPEPDRLFFIAFDNAHSALVAPGNGLNRVFLRDGANVVYIHDTGRRIDDTEGAVKSLVPLYVTEDGMHGLSMDDCVALTLMATKNPALAMPIAGAEAPHVAVCEAETTPEQVQGWHSTPWGNDDNKQMRRFVDPVQDCNIDSDGNLAPSDASTVLAVQLKFEECTGAGINTADLQGCCAGEYIVLVRCTLRRTCEGEELYRARAHGGEVIGKKFESMTAKQFAKYVMQLEWQQHAVGGTGVNAASDGVHGEGGGGGEGEREREREREGDAGGLKGDTSKVGRSIEVRRTKSIGRPKRKGRGEKRGGASGVESDRASEEMGHGKRQKSIDGISHNEEDVHCMKCKTTDSEQSILMCDGLSEGTPCNAAMCVKCTGRKKPSKLAPFFCQSGCEPHIVAARTVLNAHVLKKEQDGKPRSHVLTDLRTRISTLGLTLSETTISRWLKWDVTMAAPSDSSRTTTAPGSKATNHLMLALVRKNFGQELSLHYAAK